MSKNSSNIATSVYNPNLSSTDSKTYWVGDPPSTIGDYVWKKDYKTFINDDYFRKEYNNWIYDDITNTPIDESIYEKMKQYISTRPIVTTDDEEEQTERQEMEASDDVNPALAEMINAL